MDSPNKGLTAMSQELANDDRNARDMQYAQMLSQKVKQEQLEEQQAQLMEQQYYERLNKSAEDLLVNDKKAINARALKIQSAIKEQIRATGGSRKKFFQNGGHSLLSGYINKVANSDEMFDFKENKQNLVRIMDAQAKGFGHLIMEKDLQSMEEYQKNGKGRISYSGMLQEIEMPDPNNYDLGTDIPIQDIVDKNKLKIMANFKMEYPNIATEDISEEMLLSYASKRYSGKGSNRDNINFARKLALSKAAQAAKRNPKTSAATTAKEDRQTNVLVKLQALLNQLPKTQSAKELYGEDGTSTNWFKANAKDNAFVSNYLGRWNHASQAINLDEKGYNIHGEYKSPLGLLYRGFERLTNPNIRLAHSGEIMPTLKNEIAKHVLQSEVDENGYVNLEPDTTFFDMKGTQIDKGLNPGTYKGSYKVLGISTAMKTMDRDNKEQLLVEILDGNEVDPKLTKEFADGLSDNSEVAPAMVIALQHKDGHIFYKEMDTKIPSLNALSQELGDKVILDDFMGSQQLQSDLQAAAESMTAEEQEALRTTLSNIDNTLENNPHFVLEANEWSHKDMPELNRSGLIKAFYASLGEDLVEAGAKNNTFSSFIAAGGKEIEELFRDYENGLTDKQMIEKWFDAVTIGEPQETQQINARRAAKWIAALENYKDLKL